jgi:hypothetical protein
MPITPKKLDVTSCRGEPGRPLWTGYEVRRDNAGCVKAHVVYECARLDDMRIYASFAAYDGIVIGSPSVDWAE